MSIDPVKYEKFANQYTEVKHEGIFTAFDMISLVVCLFSRS